MSDAARLEPAAAPSHEAVVEAALSRIVAGLDYLNADLAGRLLVLNDRVELDTGQPYRDLVTPTEAVFRSVLIENPTGAWIEVGFAAGKGQPRQSDRRVPPTCWALIAHPFTMLSVGIGDAPTLAAAPPPIVYVTRYEQAFAPAAGPWH